MEKVADQLRSLGAKRVLIRAAEQGFITELRCQMPECLCPRGTTYFEQATPALPDWMPTNDHYPILACDGGREEPKNSRLAHRLCNRVDYAKLVDRPYEKDLARVAAARARAEGEQPRLAG